MTCKHFEPIALALAAMLVAKVASADRVVVKGTTLEGNIKTITESEVVIETVYGKGNLVIATKDVESIETTAPFHVRHSDGAETVGRVVGVNPKTIMIDTAGAAPVEVAFAGIQSTQRDPGANPSLYEKMKLELPYWSGDVELSGLAEFGTTDLFVLSTALDVKREQGPYRFRAQLRYLYDTEKVDGSYQVFDNKIFGYLRQEYDFAPRFFVFGSVNGTYDQIDAISLRTIPTLGLGYKVLEREAGWFRVDAGAAYYFDRHFRGSGTVQYAGPALGAESDWKLPFAKAAWHNRLDYVFSPNYTGNYFLRYEGYLRIPIWEALSFKYTIINEYDSRPAQGTAYNDVENLLGFILSF